MNEPFMNTNMLKIMAVLLGVLGILYYGSEMQKSQKPSGPQSEFIIVHNTPERMKVYVTVGGQTFQSMFGAGRGSQTTLVRFRNESAYDIRVEFSSGKVLQKSLGRVTPGVSQQDRIEITDNDIKLMQSPQPSA